MSGVKGRSGRRLKYLTGVRLTKEEQANIIVLRVLQDETIPLLERVKTALPVCLKTMTEKQAVATLSIGLSLESSQVTDLIDLAKRNASIYKGLDALDNPKGLDDSA